MDAKRALRAEARALPAPAPGVADACLGRLLGQPELAGPGTLALYASTPGEPPVERLDRALRARGWELVYPRVRGLGLELACVSRPEELVEGYRGLREPSTGSTRVAADRVDVFCVPGLLFARDGVRLGRGGGHYDRLLSDAAPQAVRIGICYSDRVRAALPVEAHDMRVDWIVTEQEAWRTGAREQG